MYKYLLFVLLIFGCASESNNNKSENDYNNALSISALQKAAMKQYMESPVLALPMMEKLAVKYVENNNPKGASETYFNIAKIYDETLDKKDKALFYGQKSLETAVLAKDEKQQANLLMYNGYVKALTGNTKVAKKDIVDSIMKYKALNDEVGLAAAQFNLARVFYIEGALDESAHFLAKSMNHYRSTNNATSIFNNNLFAISLFRKMNNPTKVQEIIDENKSLIPSIKYEGYLQQEFEQLMKADNKSVAF